MKKPSSGRLTEAQIREGLIEIGLKEVTKFEEGFAFTHWKVPHDAVKFYSVLHGGTEATKFYIAPAMYVLAE